MAEPTGSRISTSPPLAGLGLACLLFVLAGALPAWHLYSGLRAVLDNSATREIAAASLREGGPLLLGVLGYAAALLVLHTCAGAACWLVARAAESAFRLPATGRRRRSVAVALLGCAWVFAANAWAFPNSAFAGPLSALVQTRLGPVDLFAALSCAAAVGTGATFLLAIVRTARAQPRRRPTAAHALAAAGLFAGAAAVALPLSNAPVPATAAPADARPNVIIVGIDSLRCNLDGLAAPGTLTPNVDRFLEGAHRFTDATTPLARTFPAWVSILTGRHPVTTGARVNLTPRERIHEGNTLADLYAAAGYRTVLATDEVRFSNIDESYGYQQLIAPRIGGTDFLIGGFNDIPLVNLATLFPASRHVFPDLYANRAAHVTYRPEAFVTRVASELGPDSRPTFMVVHLTLAHWPYTWARSTGADGFANMRPNYAAALREVDSQFAATMRALTAEGLLTNAIVVVLSDHGEAVGLGNDSSLPRGSGDDVRRFASMYGHGNSVLGPHQYRVVLAMRAYGSKLLTDGGAHDVPVTLEDVAPTLLDLTLPSVREPHDGLSLAAVLRGAPHAKEALRNRLRFTESEFRPPSVPGDERAARKLAASASEFYRLDAATGRLVLNEHGLTRILASKEYAVLQGARKLAAVPDGATRRFYWFDGASAFPRTTTDPAVLATDPVAAPLLAALERRFPGEIVAR